jgi:5'-deoxynucleotidase YfbR-like HD superfamily hydrolase
MTAMLVARELCTLPVVTDEHDKELILAALLHDAHEAYWGFGDIQTPAKSVLGTPFRIALREHARRFDVVIAQRFGLDVDLFHHEFVKRADLVARAIERRDCMSALRPGISCSTSFVEVSEVLPDETVRIKRRSEQDDVTWFLGSLASLRPAERASIVSSYQEEYRCDPSSVILHQWV